MTQQHIDLEVARIQNKLREWGFNLTLTRDSKIISWIEWGKFPLDEEDIVTICSWIQDDIESGKIAQSELVDMGYSFKRNA